MHKSVRRPHHTNIHYAENADDRLAARGDGCVEHVGAPVERVDGASRRRRKEDRAVAHNSARFDHERITRLRGSRRKRYARPRGAERIERAAAWRPRRRRRRGRGYGSAQRECEQEAHGGPGISLPPEFARRFPRAARVGCFGAAIAHEGQAIRGRSLFSLFVARHWLHAVRAPRALPGSAGPRADAAPLSLYFVLTCLAKYAPAKRPSYAPPMRANCASLEKLSSAEAVGVR